MASLNEQALQFLQPFRTQRPVLNNAGAFSVHDSFQNEHDASQEAEHTPVRVSVAMTTYHADKGYLQQQLDSICAQTRAVDEVVITDDGPDVDTADWLDAYISRHRLANWTVLRHEKNLGVSRAFTDSISACSGDIIFLCDQDDIWAPEKVASFCAIFVEHPEVKCLLGNYRLIDENSDPITVSKAGDNLFFRDWNGKRSEHLYHISVASILGHNTAPGATQAFRSDVKNTFLQVKGHRRMHDWRINIVAALQFDGLFYTDLVYTSYRRHSSNVVGVDAAHLELPERQGFWSRTAWKLSFLRSALSFAHAQKNEPYKNPAAFSICQKPWRVNRPKEIKSCYFELCHPEGAALASFKSWKRYVRAANQAVKAHRFSDFRKLRKQHAACYSYHFDYDMWPERLACWLRDFYWCTSGWKAQQ